MPTMTREARPAPRAREHTNEPHGAARPRALPEAGPRATIAQGPAGCPCGGGCPTCFARAGASGHALDPGTRGYFETALGADLSGVRVHADADAAHSAKSLHASAFSVGQDIHFGEGRYRPQSGEGRDLLGHELIHVLQQRHLALAGEALLATRDHALERNAQEVAEHGAPIARADRPMILRQGEGETPGRFSPSFARAGASQLSLGGHTLDGDTQAVRSLLQSQLSVGPTMLPVYFGMAMSLPDISAMLGHVTPALTEAARWTLVQSVWWDKVNALRQLPPLYASLIQLPATTPTMPTGPFEIGLSDRAPVTGLSSPTSPASAGGGSGWAPSMGSQVLINIARGRGTPLAQGAGQRQYTLGDDVQVVFQDSTDAASLQYSAMVGGQIQGDSPIDSKIMQLQPFVQLMAGLAQMPGNLSVSMVVQVSAGAQLTLKFGPITIQVAAGLQLTAQQGQGTLPSLALQAMIGPTAPDPGSGARSFGPHGNWWVGVGTPPPLPGAMGQPDRQVGGGMLNFGGNLPSWLQ